MDLAIAAAIVVAIAAFCYWYRVREHAVTQGSLYSALYMMQRRGGEHRLILRLRPGEKFLCVKKHNRHHQDDGIELLIPQAGWSEPCLDKLLAICASHDLPYRRESVECNGVSEYLVIDLGGDLLFASDVMMNMLVEGLGVSSSDKVAFESVNIRPGHSILK
jgi:hypothetical protein